MTTLILERHAESMANLYDMFAGHTDHDLSPRGRQQAELTATYIAAHLHIDKIVSSDLPRARQTAQAVADKLHLDVHTDPQLREIRADAWDRKTFDELNAAYPLEYGLWRNDIGNAGCPGSESTRDLSIRIMAAMTRIAEENPEKTVLVTTHATPIRAAQCLMAGYSLDEMKNIPWVSNASLTTVEYENGSWRILRVSQDEHLAELRTALPANT